MSYRDYEYWKHPDSGHCKPSGHDIVGQQCTTIYCRPRNNLTFMSDIDYEQWKYADAGHRKLNGMEFVSQQCSRVMYRPAPTKFEDSPLAREMVPEKVPGCRKA